MVDSTTNGMGAGHTRSLVAVDDSDFPRLRVVRELTVRDSDKSAAQQAKDLAEAGQPVRLILGDGKVRLYRLPWSANKAAPYKELCPGCKLNWKHPRWAKCVGCRRPSTTQRANIAKANRRRAEERQAREARGEEGIGE